MKYRKHHVLWAMLLILSQFAKADEGMWIISNIDSLLVKNMKALGLELSSEQIYNESKASVKDAVMIFDNGCTAEFVSSNGLIFTNHHCSRNRVQQVSSDERNYVRDGYWAKTSNEEIPIKGLTVKLLVKSVDLTEQAVELLKTKTWRKVMTEIEKQYNDSAIGQSASLDSYSTGQYILSVYQTFSDVRLVGVPPESVGNFGGETDNFEWPRQSADFSVFRVYANDSNMPSAYSENNKPFSPKTFLPISLSGINENDFAITIGFPAITQRYINSFNLKEELEIKNRATVITKGKYIDVLKSELDKDEGVRLKYSNKNFSAGNSYKFALGVVKLVNLSDAMQNKIEQENEFTNWVNADAERTKKYGNVFAALQHNYNEQQGPKYAHAVITGALFNDASLFGIRSRNIVEILEKNDKSQIEKAIDSYRWWYKSFSKNYDAATDQKVVKSMLKLVKNEVQKEHLPDLFKIINEKFNGDIDKYVDNMYANSIYVKAGGIEKFLKKPSIKIKSDPLFVFGISVYEKLIELKRLSADNGTEIRNAKRLFEEGMHEKDKGVLKYPDANFSMRLTYGTVSGANPRDGLIYKSQTTLTGVIEKEDSSNYEFMVSPKLKDLYYKKDFGKYSENGKMFTCFLTSTDITGGNSGSPVINGKGELTGIAFDGNFESLAGSIIYEKEKNRSINVDIRYVLFIIDKFAESNYILNELTIK